MAVRAQKWTPLMNDTPSATAILAPIWRRKWLVLIVGIVVAGGTYLYYKHKPATFQSETQLYLNAGSEQQTGEKVFTGKNAAATLSAQPDIINSVVLEQVRKQLKAEQNHTAKAAAKGKAKAKANEKSQFVNVTTEAHTPRASALLANSIASAYIRRQHTQYERGILSALAIAHRQLRRIETPVVGASKGKSKSTDTAASQGNIIREAQLNSRINQLEALLQVQSVEQLRPAKPRGARLLGPAPKKNAEFGFVIGILLAAIAAFLLGRLDRRLRLLADIEAVFPTHVLTVLPQSRRPIVDRDGYAAPSRLLLEPLRRLQATLLLADSAPKQNGGGSPVGGLVPQDAAMSAQTALPLGDGNAPAESAVAQAARRHVPRTILFLSPETGDGRSTVIADLALVQREAGERVAVLEADFRRPSQSRLLGVPPGMAGLPEVLAGALTLPEALQSVPAPELEPVTGQAGGFSDAPAAALASREGGEVALLSSRAAAVNPPALLASAAMGDVLHGLAEEFDRVLIDVPSPLEVSDAMPLLSAADAIVIVARAAHTHERSARRLWQLLTHTPTAPVLGVVANGVAPRDIEKYGISSGSGNRQGLAARLFGR
jgi:Mrp family chromosome partitioning ATPase/capsular polysaccharide biosynthesis protein